jgi:transposase-like protein
MGKTADNVTWATIRGRAHWSPELAQRVLADLKRSGLSASSFAAKHELGLERIYYWQRRLKARASETEARTGLVEVRVSGPTDGGTSSRAPARIEIELLNGRRLSVAESTDLEQLGRLVALLERA